MITAIVLTLAAAILATLCAASDGAMLALDPDETLPPALAAVHDRRERTHRALAFARVSGQLVTGIGVALLMAGFGLPVYASLLLALAAGILLVGVTESVARSAGDSHARRTAGRLLLFMRAVERLLAPVVILGEIIDRGLALLLPRTGHEVEEREAAEEQFKQVVAAEADVSKDERVILNGVFRLARTEVQDIMIPRVDITAVDSDMPWSEVLDRVRSSEHSRLPVFSGTIDNIVGLLYAKDLLPFAVGGTQPEHGWLGLVRPATFIPGARKADEQLRDFQSGGTHLAIVADEFGGTAGLITIEDVLEEIVGEIRDENDEEEAPLVVQDGKRYWVSASMTLSELSDALGHDFQREAVSTVGGLVYELLGRVPRAGEELVVDGFRVVVERVDRRRVRRVYFERVEANAEHAA